jgi:hypothetical protein
MQRHSPESKYTARHRSDLIGTSTFTIGTCRSRLRPPCGTYLCTAGLGPQIYSVFENLAGWASSDSVMGQLYLPDDLGWPSSPSSRSEKPKASGGRPCLPDRATLGGSIFVVNSGSSTGRANIDRLIGRANGEVPVARAAGRVECGCSQTQRTVSRQSILLSSQDGRRPTSTSLGRVW